MVQALPVRLSFSKVGSLQFISHLDLARAMSKIIIRSGVPIWYTEGFNPRPKLVFALPLSVGTESVCELLDFKITEHMPFDEIAERIQRQFPLEMRVNGVFSPTHKFQDIGFSEYEMSITSSILDVTCVDKTRNLLDSPIIISKKTKSGVKDIDIRPLMKDVCLNFDSGELKINALLSASNTEYLNPEYFIKAVAEKLGIDFGDIENNAYRILRTKIKMSDGVTDFS